MLSFVSRKVRSNKIKTILISLIALLVIVTPLFYWSSARKSADPRVEKVKFYYKAYEKSLKDHDLKNGFVFLDSIQSIYSMYIDYKNSNEMGQVLNRKAVNWIQIALIETEDSIKHNYLDSARYFAEKSIMLFEQWINDYNHLSRNEIIIKIQADYINNDSTFKGRNLVKIINNRTDEIINDQIETHRHLSIAYTNLGTVYQYFGDYKLAIKSNRKALDIWNGNETAKKNIKTLIDRSFH